MPRFENNIMGLIPREEWLDIPFEVNRPNDPIDQLFGDVKTDNLIAYWESIAAEYQVPLMAQFHGFDTESQKTFRIPVDTHNIEKGLIKVKIDQSERMRALLRSGVQNDQMYEAYDTYKCAGLPAGAICNPGLAAINAVLYPEKTGFYYFYANVDTKTTYFARTLEEHNKNIARANGEYVEEDEPEDSEGENSGEDAE